MSTKPETAADVARLVSETANAMPIYPVTTGIDMDPADSIARRPLSTALDAIRWHARQTYHDDAPLDIDLRSDRTAYNRVATAARKTVQNAPRSW